MRNNNEMITELSIETLLNEDAYIIPRYQRDYAWTNNEITQLLQDIIDSQKIDRSVNYYLGSLIVYERKKNKDSKYEIVDGQQRFTTLFLILSVLKKYSVTNNAKILNIENINLEFECRNRSTQSLKSLFSDNQAHVSHSNIENGYQCIEKVLKNKFNSVDETEKITKEDFVNYFFKQVKLLRITLPEDTNLNKYFEIMNSRGEQLEKHEILKAQLLQSISENERYTFNTIWEACSNMEKYVQYGFKAGELEREKVFGAEWDVLYDVETVFSIVKTTEKVDVENNNDDDNSLKHLLANKIRSSKKKVNKDDGSDSRFNTIINFSNFLLHVLRILTQCDIPLDDKRLLSVFEPFVNCDIKKIRALYPAYDTSSFTKEKFAKDFGYALLKCKFLFDKYIIKREFKDGNDEWSLKKLKKYDQSASYVATYANKDEFESSDINQQILILLSMFHVSTPTLVYKHWLSGVLNFLYSNYSKEVEINDKEYIDYLQNMSKAFLYDRFLAKEPKDYYTIIFENKSTTSNNKEDLNISTINTGTSVENYVFNHLDYLLWKEIKQGNNKYISDKDLNNFAFSFRSSVEHYYPQNPLDGIPKLHPDILNNFGNLCLITPSKNSQLSNNTPQAKREYYLKAQKIDTLKQKVMMKGTKWSESEILEHGQKMKELLLRDI